MAYTVYKHTSPSGKVYIGITSLRPEERWGGGAKYVKNKHFNRAIKKYGWENIKHEILFDGLSREDAFKIEIELIKEYRSNERQFGYNIGTGGEHGSTGTKWSEQSRKNHMAAIWSKPRKHSEERKRNIGKGVKKHLLENPNNYPFINHKDENPSNNRVDNLEWCTAEYNNHYGTRIERFSKSNRKPIVQYSKNGSVIKRYDSLKSAAKETGISKCSISSCTKDDLKYAGGFLWAYENQGQDSVISERCRQKMNNKSYAKVYPYPKNLLCDMYYWEQNADEKMSFIFSLSDEQIKAVSDEIDKAIEAKLDERMKRTIILRYKYNAKYREIGEEFGVKQERVRQIKNKAVRRIAKPVKEFVKQNWF